MKWLGRSAGWMLLAVSAAAWGTPDQGRAGIEPRVHLRDAIEVQATRVWLSDFLPRDAPSSLQSAGARIELCPAPQPGSARVLDGNEIRIRLTGQPELLGQLAIPARLTVRNAAWPLREETVRMAISEFLRKQKQDLPAEARLEWSPPLAASADVPSVKVVGLDWDRRQESMQVRMRCAKRASCGSFLVHVILPPPLSEEWRVRLRSGGNTASSGSDEAASAHGDGAVLAEKGRPATLILEDGSMRISLRVVCLQAGMLKQQIRVFDARTRQVFQAEVVGRGIVRTVL